MTARLINDAGANKHPVHTMNAKSILLAIPDDWILDECKFHLECSNGFDVDTACDGLECWTRMNERMPDVLVLDEDLLWGGADGVAARLIDESRSNSVPILVMADRIGPHEARDNLSRLKVRYLYRPFPMTELSRALDSLLPMARLKSD